MKINKKGSTRTIIEFKKFVLKIPNITLKQSTLFIFLIGWASNISENTLWKYQLKNGNLLHLLCPIIGCYFFGLILVMKKADEITTGQFKEIHLNTDFAKLSKDNKIENYGIFNGRIVMIDYAVQMQ